MSYQNYSCEAFVDVSPHRMPGKTVIQVSQSQKPSRAKTQKKQSTKRRTQRRTKKIAFATTYAPRKPYFRVKHNKANSQEIIVEGEDLIIPTPNTLPTEAAPAQVFLVIPANPLYWVGTRISGIAAVYQQFRPLGFDVEYIPQVPVTCPGQVIVGTLWNNGSPNQTLQQTLMSSNGGNMRACYEKFKSHVICSKRTLPLNFYNVHDDLALNTSNPFYWMAHYSGAWKGSNTPTTNQPGWVYVKWRYAFSVGLGNRGEEVQVFNQLDEQTATAFSMKHNLQMLPGWGVTFAYLKRVGTKILRKICAVLVEEVNALAGQAGITNGPTDLVPVKLFTGSAFTLSPSELTKSIGQDVTMHASDGVPYQVSDNTRIVCYMEGTEVTSDIFDKYTFAMAKIGFPDVDVIIRRHQLSDDNMAVMLYLADAPSMSFGNVVWTFRDDQVESIALSKTAGGTLTMRTYFEITNNETEEVNTTYVDYELQSGSGLNTAEVYYPPIIEASRIIAWYNTLPEAAEPILHFLPHDPGDTYVKFTPASMLQHATTMRRFIRMQ